MENTSYNVPVAEFTTMTVELEPGLPTVASESNDMAPPAYIPFSGLKSMTTPVRVEATRRAENSTKKQRNGGDREENQMVEMGTTKTPNADQQRYQRSTRMLKSPAALTSTSSSLTEYFDVVNPSPASALSVPIRGIRNEAGVVKYPLLLCSQEGTIMLSLAGGVIIEICVDRSFRIVCNNDFMIYVNNGGTVSSVLHKYAKIVHSKDHVHCKFVSANDRLAVVGPEGVLFSMDNLSEAYLVSSAKGLLMDHAAFAIAKPDFPIQNIDYTLHQMYAESKLGSAILPKCSAILNKAVYEKKMDGNLVININGITIRSNSKKGEVSVKVKAVRVDLNSKTLSIHLRTPCLDMAIEDRDKCYVKRSDKRIHTSRSGMVVSDGACAISMDQFGRILSCA